MTHRHIKIAFIDLGLGAEHDVPVIPNRPQFVIATVVCAIVERISGLVPSSEKTDPRY